MKLSARLDVKLRSFVIVDIDGRYILKPRSVLYAELPENEDLTMRLAASVGTEFPPHGLIFSRDGSLTYFIKRFDRRDKAGKIHLEDFALPLGGKKRNLSRTLFLDYYAAERLQLNPKVIDGVLREIQSGMEGWDRLIQRTIVSYVIVLNILSKITQCIE